MVRNKILASKITGLSNRLLPKATEKLSRALKYFPVELSGALPVLSLENSRSDHDAAGEINYATSLSAGFDLKAADDAIIPPGEWRLVDTGLRLAPQSTKPVARIRLGRTGFDVVAELQIRPRSGLAVKRGITVLNAPGTVDADYEGKIMTCLMNHGSEPFKISKGDKVSQGVFALAIRPHSVAVADKTRGEGGFGSTGH
ncbi:dUTP diphosphatase [bacterium]|nr:dUTP diphosphatase [bacterium]